ncbi:LOW QUALITY PROTEIN: recombination inhibitory protein MutS2 [Geomicrobium sp. JCM 19055]|nr:LOW QUALITY PROTEIN: recombination inhibitory protein MutS2 [Geomicrobium sp. JCM 19055]
MLHTLEYKKMKEQLLTHVSSALGRERVEQLTPEKDANEVKRLLDETYEATEVLRLRGHVPLGGLHDIRFEVKRASLGSVLDAKAINETADTIRVGNQLTLFMERLFEDEEDIRLPNLNGMIEQILPLKELYNTIRKAISEEGYVLDSASAELRAARQQIRTFESTVRSRLEQIIRSSDADTKLSDRVVTVRNDRYVIPVKAAYRHSYGGIVHDQSASGQTVFVEPQSVVNANNQLREARLKERNEIEKILRELSLEVGAESAVLLINVEQLATIDFTFAKAKYAKSIVAIKPKINEEYYLHYPKARHPLLDQETVVPTDLTLGREYTSLVITGPNTGGKTVALKTTGLLTLMAQSGLFLPTDEGAEATVFDSIHADIGDEQSIEQSLSTFSSHMTNIVSILKSVDHRSLVLFDELGAGTDPQEGAALAVSILDEVHARGARTVATTHYTELKGYAYNRTGVMNASVEFDVASLSPTYRLLIGIPGRSNAFAISRRLGLDDFLIEAAEKELTADTKQAEQMITSLEDQQQVAQVAKEEADELRQSAEKLHEELEEAFNDLERKKRTYLKRSGRKSAEEVELAKLQAEEIIGHLRELQKQGSSIKEHELIDAKKGLEDAAPKLTKKQKQVKRKAQKAASFIDGEEVFVQRFNQKGQILEKVSDKEYLVQIGIMKMTVTVDDLQKTEQPKQKELRPVTRVQTSGSTVKPELDLRGERYENALSRLEKYLDEAVLAGYPTVHIIHGKGTGALRKGVKQYLAKHPSVKSTRDGGMNEGGIGNTVADLK